MFCNVLEIWLWQACFFRYRHPDLQYDRLFHGCSAVWGEQYRQVRLLAPSC